MTLAATSIDWTQIALALVAIIPSMFAAYLAYRIHVSIRTPSGTPIGQVAEKTHDLSSADLAMTTQVHNVVTKPNGA